MEAKSSPQSGNPHDPLLLPEQFAFLPFGLDEAWKMGISTYQKIPKTTDKFPGFPHLSVSVKGASPLTSTTVRSDFAKLATHVETGNLSTFRHSDISISDHGRIESSANLFALSLNLK